MYEPPTLDCGLEACRRSLVAGDFRRLGEQLEAVGDEHPWEAWARRSLSKVARTDRQELVWGLLTISLVLITYALSL